MNTYENLIKPLATNQSSKKLYCIFKEGIISKFKDRLSKHNLKIQELEFKIHYKVQNKLEIISDDNEQYSRRSCLCIHVFEFKKGDAEDKKCCGVIGISFNDRAMASKNPSWVRNGKRELGQ